MASMVTSTCHRKDQKRVAMSTETAETITKAMPICVVRFEERIPRTTARNQVTGANLMGWTSGSVPRNGPSSAITTVKTRKLHMSGRRTLKSLLAALGLLGTLGRGWRRRR